MTSTVVLVHSSSTSTVTVAVIPECAVIMGLGLGRT